MTTLREVKEDSGSDLESFELPETVLCVDTICNICYAEFLDEEDLQVHIRKLHITEQSRSRYCPFCSSIFASIEDYAQHICEVHIMNLKCCKYCLRAFSHTQEVKRHEKKHLSSNSKTGYTCSNCNLVFETVVNLEKHEYKEHNDSTDGVLLQACFSLLSSYLNIRAPVFLHSLRVPHIYKCAVCNLTTPHGDYYLQHLQQKNCRSLVCDKCCCVFRNLPSLKRHFRAHFECKNQIYKETNLPCGRCNKMFKIDLLQEHTKICEAVKCSSCNITFATVNERAIHQTKAHPAMFSIKICKYCHREFVGQVALDKHIQRSHKNDMHLYKYFCIYCNDIFKHPKKLFSHFFSKHKDLNPFTCQICEKNFKLRKQFTLHIKLVHSSCGTVRFDEKYHVVFTDGAPVPQEGVSKNQNDSSTKIAEVYIEDNSTQLSMISEQQISQDSVSDNDVNLVMCPTETEADQTDNMTDNKIIKHKRKMKTKKPLEYVDLTVENYNTDDSEDEPLIKMRRKKARPQEKIGFPQWLQRSNDMRKNRRKFTCKICEKYCYTYQNYNHHMSLHQKHENKKCIKCPKVFKSKEKLNKHIVKEHSSSKLTETLKSIVERRKNTNENNEYDEAKRRLTTEKFLRTIKKVNIDTNDTLATVTPVVNKLSVKKFIENFTPESNGINTKKTILNINNSITLKPVNTKPKPPLIKLIKYTESLPETVKLKPPEKYKDTSSDEYIVTLKIVYTNDKPKMNFDTQEDALPIEFSNIEGYEEDYTQDTDIPEVAEEIMLEGTEENPQLKEVYQKVIIPNISMELKDVRIAHLMPVAPFYKIVKIDDVLKEQETKELEKNIKLPNGAKFVSVNPLAHLLEGKQVYLPKNKYYKPKEVDFERALANALFTNTTTSKAKKTRKRS